jgi:hypothetical protein
MIVLSTSPLEREAVVGGETGMLHEPLDWEQLSTEIPEGLAS